MENNKTEVMEVENNNITMCIYNHFTVSTSVKLPSNLCTFVNLCHNVTKHPTPNAQAQGRVMIPTAPQALPLAQPRTQATMRA